MGESDGKNNNNLIRAVMLGFTIQIFIIVHLERNQIYVWCHYQGDTCLKYRQVVDCQRKLLFEVMKKKFALCHSEFERLPSFFTSNFL